MPKNVKHLLKASRSFTQNKLLQKLALGKACAWELAIFQGMAKFYVLPKHLVIMQGMPHSDDPLPLEDLFGTALHPQDLQVLQDGLASAVEPGDPVSCLLRVRMDENSDWQVIRLYGSLDNKETPSRAARFSGYAHLAALEPLEQAASPSLITTAKLGIWDWNYATGQVRYTDVYAPTPKEQKVEHFDTIESWIRNIHSDDQALREKALQEYLDGKTSCYECTVRIVTKPNSPLWLYNKGQVVERDENGAPLRLMGITQDVTEQKKVELSLKKNTRHLELIVEHLGLGMWFWDILSGQIVFNDNFSQLLGYARDELDHTIEARNRLIHPNDLLEINRLLNNLFKGSIPKYNHEIRVRHKDGHYIWVQDFCSIVERQPNGMPSLLVGGYLNIDERKQQEQLLHGELQAIAVQKAVLEIELEERTVLLHTIEKRVQQILRASDLELPVVTEMPNLEETNLSEITHLVDKFAQNLSVAFDLITNKMWWYKSIIDSIPFPISVADQNNHWVYMNGPALSAYGIQALTALIDSQGSDENPTLLQYEGENALAALANNNREFLMRDPVRHRYFQGQASYLWNYHGDNIGHIETMQDATEVYEANERIKDMLDVNPLGCSYWDASLNIIDCNMAVIELFGLSDKREFMTKFEELSPPFQPNGEQSKQLLRTYAKQAFSKGYVRFDWMHQKLDGTHMPTEVTFARLSKGEGNYFLVNYIQDLTALKAKEHELDKERRLLRIVMESSPVCFVILVNERIRFATPYALMFFGVDIGGSIADFYVNDLERAHFLSEVNYTGAVNWRVVSVQAADGTTKDMLAHAFLADYYGEKCVMSWFLDVTNMREKERELRQARDIAEQSAKAKSDFLANMSHEIRTPMNAILGMSNLVLDTELSEYQRNYLQKVEFSAKALLRIINDILDFSKVEAGKMEVEQAPFYLAPTLRNAMDLFRDHAGEKQLTLSLQIAPNTPSELIGDQLRLTQILTNLVGNALKFTEKGSVTLKVAPLKNTYRQTILHFSVIDTGIGLPPEKLDTLFSPFSQADTSTTRRYGGTGLGLTISKRLVELMGGTITCESAVGLGTKFNFTIEFQTIPSALPIGASPQIEDSPQVQGKPEELVKHLIGKKILVAEDNEINQIIVTELLEKAGFEVSIASDGYEAVDMVLRGSYDLVFMDIQMPGKDGFSATHDIRRHARFHELPIIAMTAHAMVGDKEKSLAANMNDHVTKPIDSYEVFSVIAKWLTPGKMREEPTVSEQIAAGITHPAIPSLMTIEPADLEKILNIRDSFPSELPGIRVAQGLANADNNTDSYLANLIQAGNNLPAIMEELSTAVLTGDAETLFSKVATLCAMGNQLGLFTIRDTSKKIEKAAQHLDYPAMFLLLDQLEHAVNQFKLITGYLQDLANNQIL